MADVLCGYTDNRDETLVAYLYDNIDPVARASFDAHLTACERCRAELADLGGVRQRLATWAPPLYGVAGRTLPLAPLQTPAAGRQLRWRDIPAWAQVAAALLFLGVSAGIANLDIRYDKDGLSVRTGWSKNTPADTPLKSGVSPATVAHDVNPAGSAPWRADFAALEQRLRTEFQAVSVSTQTVAAHPSSIAAGMSDTELLRRMRVMIDENTKQQQTELALRIAQLITDVNEQRSADLARINSNLALLDGNTKTLYGIVRTSSTR